MDLSGAIANRTAPVSNRGNPPRSLLVERLPLLKPPYGVFTAIDMNAGEILWQIPHGRTPDRVREHPALQGLEIARTGQNGYSGSLVTSTLLIAGEPQMTSDEDGTLSAYLRAYDKQTGAELGAVRLPAPQTGSPMTYLINGRQHLVVAVSGTRYSGELIALSLPVD